MFVLDRPLIPKYTRAKLTSESTTTSASSSSHRRGQTPSRPPSTTTTRVSSVADGRPYSTSERRISVVSTGSFHNGRVVSKTKKKQQKSSASSTSTTNNGEPRQWSADSGIDSESGNFRSNEGDKFILPPRITSYSESESYLMSLPRCDQFVTHLARNLRPMLAELRIVTPESARKQVHDFAPRLKRLAQELVIAFPRSASLVSNSPRFQEFLRLSVEKCV